MDPIAECENEDDDESTVDEFRTSFDEASTVSESTAETEVTYPSTMSSWVGSGPGAARQCMLWLIDLGTSHINPLRRGPLTTHIPVCGIYDQIFDYELREAIKSNDPVKARERLESGANPNQACGPVTLRALHWAAIFDAHDVIPELVKAGGDVNWLDAWQNSALMCATFRGNPKSVRALVKHRANVNDRAQMPWFLRFLGGYCCDSPAVTVASSFFQHLPTVKALLECKANPCLKNKAGMTAIESTSDTPAGLEIRAVLEEWQRNNRPSHRMIASSKKTGARQRRLKESPRVESWSSQFVPKSMVVEKVDE